MLRLNRQATVPSSYCGGRICTKRISKVSKFRLGDALFLSIPFAGGDGYFVISPMAHELFQDVQPCPVERSAKYPMKLSWATGGRCTAPRPTFSLLSQGIDPRPEHQGSGSLEALTLDIHTPYALVGVRNSLKIPPCKDSTKAPLARLAG
jgi:hypothetical protein